MKKLYKIWRISTGHTKDAGLPYVIFDSEKGTWSYPLVNVISTYPYLYRDDVVSTDQEKIRRQCDYLNEMADSGIHHEVREESCPLTYKDTTFFCCNPKCSGKCNQQFTTEDYRKAEEWWCGPDFPIAFMDVCGELGILPPADLAMAVKAKLEQVRPKDGP